MSKFEILQGLSAVTDAYDAVFCDVWGVIHNGRSAFSEACDALAKFRETGKPVVLISNAPVQAEHVEALFPRVGVRSDCYDVIATSGDATRAEIERRAPGPIWILGADEGWEHDRYLFAGVDLTYSTMEEAAFIVLMGLRDQLNDKPEDYRDELQNIAALGKDIICANPDIQVRVGDRLVWCGGALARIYEELGGSVVYPGKPHAPIYDLAYEHLRNIAEPVDRERILAIGDGPATDVAGAQTQGLDCIYVGTGLVQAANDFRTQTEAIFEEHGVSAKYAMPRLKWE